MVLDLLFISTARWRRMKFFQNFQENGTRRPSSSTAERSTYNATWPHWKTHKFQEVPIKVRSSGGEATKNWNFLARISLDSFLFFCRPLKSHFYFIQFSNWIVYSLGMTIWHQRGMLLLLQTHWKKLGVIFAYLWCLSLFSEFQNVLNWPFGPSHRVELYI